MVTLIVFTGNLLNRRDLSVNIQVDKDILDIRELKFIVLKYCYNNSEAPAKNRPIISKIVINRYLNLKGG